MNIWRETVLATALIAALAAPQARAGHIAVDVASGDILQQSAADLLRFPASITKLMTAFVALDAVAAGEIALDASLTVSANAAAAPPVKLGLRAGQQITLKTAIHAILTRSSNDAARAIAEGVAGSEAAFAQRMTAAARRLGMTDTVFRNASGLPNRGQVTTALDVARMIAALDRVHGDVMRPLFRAPLAWAGQQLAPRNGAVASPAGSVLGKTGFTCDAGFTAALLVERDGRQIAIVTLGNPRKAIRAQAIARLARGEVPTAAALADPPVVIPRDTCLAGRRKPSGWTISLGVFRTEREARRALSAARKAGVSFAGRAVRRAGQPGFHALLAAPSRNAARDAVQPLRRARLRPRILRPQKVAAAEFEPD